MGVYRDFHRRSLAERESFWAEEARLVHWQRPFDQVLDYSRPPFARWFVGGRTNLCHNAIDRHLAARADQKALAWISTEVNETRSYTYRQLFAEVNRVAAMMQDLGVKQGDRGIVYMPMIPEAAFAMLACARLGAIPSAGFGGVARGRPPPRLGRARRPAAGGRSPAWCSGARRRRASRRAPTMQNRRSGSPRTAAAAWERR